MEQYPSAIAHLRRAHALVTERRLATLCSGVETQSFDNMANKGLQVIETVVDMSHRLFGQLVALVMPRSPHMPACLSISVAVYCHS